MKLFLRVEQGFDKLFNYKPQQTETYDYLNAMKNSPVAEQLELQEQDVQYNERKIEINQERNPDYNQSSNLFLSFIPSRADFILNSKEQTLKHKKGKRKKRRL